MLIAPYNIPYIGTESSLSIPGSLHCVDGLSTRSFTGEDYNSVTQIYTQNVVYEQVVHGLLIDVCSWNIHKEIDI